MESGSESDMESDLEKFDESDSEDAHEVSAKEEEIVEKTAKEDEVGKSYEVELIWIKRLEKRTDDSALKSRLLEILEEIYRTPYSVLPTEVLQPVRDQFLEGVLTPVQFLGKL